MIFHTLDELSPDFNSWLLVVGLFKKKSEYVIKVAFMSKAGWRAHFVCIHTALWFMCESEDSGCDQGLGIEISMRKSRALLRLLIVGAENSPIIPKYVLVKKSRRGVHSVPAVFQNHEIVCWCNSTAHMPTINCLNYGYALFEFSCFSCRGCRMAFDFSGQQNLLISSHRSCCAWCWYLNCFWSMDTYWQKFPN